MPSTRNSAAPLGIKVVAVWAAITGVALLILGFARTLWYVPLGAATVAAAYGLWTLRLWGLLLAGVVLAVEGIQDVIEGAFVELLVVLLVLAYLYSQRRSFPTAALRT